MYEMGRWKLNLARWGQIDYRRHFLGRFTPALHRVFLASKRRRRTSYFCIIMGLLALATSSGGLFTNADCLRLNWWGTESNSQERACILILCRNTDLEELLVTLGSFEDSLSRGNIVFLQYVFLNDVPFTTEFKEAVTEAVYPTSVSFGDIPHEQWSIPSWINTTKMEEGMAYMKAKGVIYGDNLSYRHMCRYNSGFFFRHPLVMKYDYYWRIEPGVRFLCNVQFDPFSLMKQRSLKYSFVIQLPELHETVPTLWDETVKFNSTLRTSKGHLSKFLDAKKRWNGCHYWSNFEIGDLRWFRSREYINYFNHLDRAGGFYHERWGDAPVHTLAAALMLDPSEVHFFDEIGYEHPPFVHLPLDPHSRSVGECMSREEVEATGNSSILDLHSLCMKRWIIRFKGVKAPGLKVPVQAIKFLRTAYKSNHSAF